MRYMPKAMVYAYLSGQTFGKQGCSTVQTTLLKVRGAPSNPPSWIREAHFSRDTAYTSVMKLERSQLL